MIEIPHWRLPKKIRIAKSTSGVLVTTHPEENLVRSKTEPWPTPELLQKYSASNRFRGATQEDDSAARSGLGHYCDLQSLNSEDAVTWSVFGTMAYLPESERFGTIHRFFSRLGLTLTNGPVFTWLWRRLPHPEKPESMGGPEIDFGFLSAENLVLGEAKWNSLLGIGQGINKDRSQLDLRLMYCSELANRALPTVQHFMIVGVSRTPDLFSLSEKTKNNIRVCNLTWSEVVDCFEGSIQEELHQYLSWRETYGKAID